MLTAFNGTSLTVDLKDVIGPAFYESHRAIRSGTADTVIEEGGRGSLKSSFCGVEIILWLLRGVLGSLGVIAFELLLAMVIRSFAVPVLVGLAGGVSGMLAVSKGLSLLWPFALMQAGMNANRKEDMLGGQHLPFVLACLVWAGIFLGVAALLLRARDVRAE